ncbi:MAG TPA: hypothetical protein VI451_09915 [Anaerolineales bacterium]|nr:hypothetical protein [Anaerolineales bacterium]
MTSPANTQVGTLLEEMEQHMLIPKSRLGPFAWRSLASLRPHSSLPGLGKSFDVGYHRQWSGQHT